MVIMSGVPRKGVPTTLTNANVFLTKGGFRKTSTLGNFKSESARAVTCNG